MSNKLKIGLGMGVLCAVTYLCLVYATGSLSVVTHVPNAIVKVVPQKVRVLYNNSRIIEDLWGTVSGDDDDDLPDTFLPPPIKPAWNLTSKPVPAQSNTVTVEKNDTTKGEQNGTPTSQEQKKHAAPLELKKDHGDFKPKQPVKESSQALRLKGVSALDEALARVASSSKTVLLTLVDLAFHDMAVNYYLTCLKPFGISNYIILTMHPETCKILEEYQINCFFYRDFSKGDTPSKWGTQVFKDKMNVRTDFVLDAMRLNYSVLHTDIDMYCFKNVMTSVSCPRESCDIAPLMDTSAFNAGFLLINPSPASIQVYEHMKVIAKSRPGVDDQAQLNQAMRRQKKQPGGLKVKKLPVTQFQCGVTYYENPKRFFADTAKPCPQCVVVHNNWIVTMEAKVYRAKEMHHWMYDGDNGGYYSSTDAKYLRYKNTLPDESQVSALKSALAIAEILNRTLILPTFKGRSKVPLPLNSVLRLTPFDKQFQYREHSFSSHPLVPDSVKTSVSQLFVIASQVITEKAPQVLQEEGIKVITPKDPNVGLNEQEVVEYFRDIKESILEIQSLYGAFSSFTDAGKQKIWAERCKNGIKGSKYRQYR